METKNYSDLPKVETMPENTKTPDYEAISKISKNLKVTNVEE
jgi:hypothetical protein